MRKLLVTSSILLALANFGANAADINKGKAKAAMCAACHGADGISMIPMYPNLAGQKEVYLAKQMRDFKSGARKDPVMAPMAMTLTEDDINNLAAYYASLK